MNLGLFFENQTRCVVKKILIIVSMLVLSCSAAFSRPSHEMKTSPAGTVLFTDSCGRTVELPEKVTRAAGSGAVATMFLASVAPEYMLNVNSTPTAMQMKYLPAQLASLPETGQLYGSKAGISLEELIAIGADVLIDMGDYKDGIKEDLDALQAQTGIPCIFIEADLVHMAQAFRTLGTVLYDKEKRAEELAVAVETSMALAENAKAQVKDSEKLSVMFTSAKDGLGTNAKGSSQAQVIELVGAENAIVVEKVSSKGGGNIVSLEQVYNADPDVIIFSPDSIYYSVASDPAWNSLRAVKEGRFYQIPGQPYNWMSNPPSLNMVLGIRWLGNLLYPQYFDYDIVAVAQQLYAVFWNYSLSNEEARSLLGL